MELFQYIQNPTRCVQQSEHSVIMFQSTAYPQNFFMHFFDRLRKESDVDIKSIDIQSGDFEYKSQLAMSFLGMSCVYWISDTTSLKPKQKDDLMAYLSAYQGPHKILVYCDAKTDSLSAPHVLVVQIKDKYFFEDAKKIWVSADIAQAQKIATFLVNLYKIKNSFTLDELCLLKNYQELIAHDAKSFYTSWVTRLVVPESSLFHLSQLLFEKKEEAFFSLWGAMKSLYSEMFWISFWSDQLYRSYFFIAYTHDEQFAAAKQMGFGLSFSFMKQSYKQYQLHELQSMHEALCAIDTALKNGGHSYLIDQLFMQFFIGKFKR